MTMGGQGKSELWLFGGEFSSRNFNIYFHYSDFWKLDTDKREWEKIDVRGAPTGMIQFIDRIIDWEQNVDEIR